MIWLFASFFAWVGVTFFRKYYAIPFLIIIVVLSAFRYYVGSDFDNYVVLYDNAVLGLLIPVELSYSLVSVALSEMGFNFQALLALYAFLTYVFIYMGLKEISRDKEFLGVVIFFIYLIFYFPSMSIVRQALAASIAFWGVYRFLHSENYLKFLMVVAAASFIHLSSIFYVLCIPFYIFRPKKVYYLLSIGMATLLGMTVFGSILGSVVDIIGFDFKGYKFQSTPLPVPIFLINTVVLGLGFIYLLLKIKLNRKDYFLINIVFFILILRLLALDFQAMNRVSAGFSIFIPVLLYQLVFVKLTKKSRIYFFIMLAQLLIMSDLFRATKDYSYYQYTINTCIYNSPCPVSIVGDLPLEDLLIPEDRR